MSHLLLDAIRTDDASEVARVLEAHPALAATLNDPLDGYSFGQTALMAAAAQANREIIDVLLRAGADINQKSHWWAGGFHVLDGAARQPWLPSFLIGRGAELQIHHAVQLGMVDDVRRMLAEDPARIHARGGDGQLPLHYAQTVDMAEYLVSRGAHIDGRDIDHESTAAQYMIRDRQPVARYLVRCGTDADLLMASALGDLDLVRRLLDESPDAIRTRVSPNWFPMRDPRAGGTIYLWTLGAEKSAHEIAREFGHDPILRVLIERSPASLQFAAACLTEDTAIAASMRGAVPAIDPADHVWLAVAARRNNAVAVRRMLEAGWPVDAAIDGATALHWAAYLGNAELVAMLLARGASTELRDSTYQGTPRGWAEHGAANAGRDFAPTLALLRDAPR